MKKVKFIWEFRGLDGKGTAAHHTIHLKEYANKHQLEETEVGEETVDEVATAYIIVKEADAESVHQALAPLKGLYVNN